LSVVGAGAGAGVGVGVGVGLVVDVDLDLDVGVGVGLVLDVDLDLDVGVGVRVKGWWCRWDALRLFVRRRVESVVRYEGWVEVRRPRDSRSRSAWDWRT
jgi:hypothetical protein